MRKITLLVLAAATATLIGASAPAALAAPDPPSEGLGAFVPASGISSWEALTGETLPIIENDLTFSAAPDETSFFNSVKAANGIPYLGIQCNTACESTLQSLTPNGSSEVDAFASAIKAQLSSAGLSEIYMTLDPENNDPNIPQQIPSAPTFRAAWDTIFHALLAAKVPVIRVYQVTASYASNYSVYQIYDAQVLPSFLAFDLFGPDGRTLTTMSCPDISGETITTVPDCAQNAVSAAEALGFPSSKIMFGSTAVDGTLSNQCAAWANLQNFSVNYGLDGFLWFDIDNSNGSYALQGSCAS